MGSRISLPMFKSSSVTLDIFLKLCVPHFSVNRDDISTDSSNLVEIELTFML